MEGGPAGITYACVTASMSTKVLAEAGNKSNLSRQLTGFITGVVNNPNNPDERGSFNQGPFSYSYMKTNDNFTFIAIAPKEVDTRVVMSFLQEMIRDFDAGGDGSVFTGRLNNLLVKYQNAQEMDQISRIQRDLDLTKEIMTDNVVRLYERGEDLSALENTAQDVDTGSQVFQDTSKQVKKAVWWKNMKCRLLICCVLVVTLLIVLFAVCGITFKKCTGEGNSVQVAITTPPTAPATPTSTPPAAP